MGYNLSHKLSYHGTCTSVREIPYLKCRVRATYFTNTNNICGTNGGRSCVEVRTGRCTICWTPKLTSSTDPFCHIQTHVGVLEGFFLGSIEISCLRYSSKPTQCCTMHEDTAVTFPPLAAAAVVILSACSRVCTYLTVFLVSFFFFVFSVVVGWHTGVLHGAVGNSGDPGCWLHLLQQQQWVVQQQQGAGTCTTYDICHPLFFFFFARVRVLLQQWRDILSGLWLWVRGYISLVMS